MFGQDRTELRQMFFTAWKKHQNKQLMEPLEVIVAKIIELHPEYHALFENETAELDKDYTPEMGQTNPFLHMAMHISIQEQLSTQRPAGIGQLHQSILNKNKDPHETEHLMMECLGKMLWEAQSQNRAPDEADYLSCLKTYI
ncbi:MAG: DUF1841 family protein [Gammaproteobacteria bacterium]|nr:DUF1841 family protein [Gammaproteobacteria bacterium]MCW8988200.1 DUF1841 family protein [Gammaproteobacteria bacterium]MCW9031407.1 DUF1841 family protein [Gammaproteobacteria bacterium]